MGNIVEYQNKYKHSLYIQCCVFAVSKKDKLLELFIEKVGYVPVRYWSSSQIRSSRLSGSSWRAAFILGRRIEVNRKSYININL